MSNNILNDISKVYFDQVVESAVPGKPAEKLGAVTAIPADEREAARKRTLAKAKEKREKMGESVVGDKARNAVADQRLDDAQRDTQQSVDKLSKREKVTRAGAHIAAKRVEADVRKSSAYGPQRPKPGTTGAYRIEGLDPVGKEDSDIDNDGKPNTKKDKYLMHRRNVIKQELATQKEAKEVKRWWDDDGDGIGYEEGEVSGKFKKKKKVKEGFSNWRGDLFELSAKESGEKEGDQTKISEKAVNNKVKINPNIGGVAESIKNLGGTLIEMVEIDENDIFGGVLDEFHDSELMFLSNELIEEVVEEFFYECLEEGYDINQVEDILIESIETSETVLNEAKVTYGHDTKIERKSNRLQKIKSAVKKVARGVGHAAGAVVRGAKAIGREVKAGYAAGKGSDDESSSSSGTRKPKIYRNTHQKSKKPGLLSRLGSKLKSGLKKAVASGARVVSRGARDVARKMDGGSSSTPKSTPSPAAKKPAEKSADPWEGSATTPLKSTPAAKKPEEKPKPKPKAKKKKSNLDSLIQSIRSEEVTTLGSRLIDTYDKAPYSDDKESEKDSAKMLKKAKSLKGVIKKEEVELYEKTLTSAETSKKEQIVKSMKKNLSGFRARYGDRAKEVMYATATKQAKKVAEQATETVPTDTQQEKPDPALAAKKKQEVSLQKQIELKKIQMLNKGVSLTHEETEVAPAAKAAAERAKRSDLVGMAIKRDPKAYQRALKQMAVDRENQRKRAENIRNNPV